MDTSAKIDNKIKQITSGSKYGLYPDGLNKIEVEEKLKSAKKWNKLLLLFTIITIGSSVTILMANIFEIADLNYNYAPLLFLMSFSLLVHYFRFRSRLKSLYMASFLYDLKGEISGKLEKV